MIGAWILNSYGDVRTLWGAGSWHAVHTIGDPMADLYCADSECLGDYVPVSDAESRAMIGAGQCDGCREACEISGDAYWVPVVAPILT